MIMRTNKAPANRMFLGVIIHAVIIWIALVLGYNSYKEVMREIDPLTRTVRDSIQSTFPLGILVFSGLYLTFSTRKRTGEIFLGLKQYVYVIVIYTSLLNIVYLAKGRDILIPLNLSILYLAILLFLCRQLPRVKINAQDWLPPIIYKHIIDRQPKHKGISAAPFIITFMLSMIICAILLISNAEKAAELTANIAYFSLVIGVVIEIYKGVKNGDNR